jgi:hypothetical protein
VEPRPASGIEDGGNALLALHRAVGNRAMAAVIDGADRTRAATLQRSPDDAKGAGVVKEQQPAGGGDLKLPWSFNDSTAFEISASGIRILVSVATKQAAAAKSVAAAIGARIAADNAVIADPARRVTTCIITPAATRFAYWGTTPVLLVDPADADVATVAHEMGHAVMDSLVHADDTKAGGGDGSGGPAGRSAGPGPASVPARVADLYLRLQATRAADDSSAPAGLQMVDPSEWSPGAKGEHPWENADEFFASAKAAYQVNPKGLARSIAKATKVDPAVGPLAKELLALLDTLFGKGKAATDAVPADRYKAAAAEVARFKSTSHIEDSVALYPLLGWLIDPATRPGRR